MRGSLLDLETPCLICDRQRLEVNAARMRARAARFGLRLRPHVKTTKSPDIARIAHGGAAGPITVSTLKEAEYFLAHGFQDICYAVALSRNKVARACALVEQGADLTVLVAGLQGAVQLVDAMAGRPGSLRVLLEIDSGEHRTGFAPDADALIVAARRIRDASGLQLRGLLTHGGHAYSATSQAEIAAVAEQERSSLLRARRTLESAGVAMELLSSGSTPTAMFGENYDGIDEIRPGVYLAGDLFQAQLGSVALTDIAVSVLASVIAHDVPRNRLVIDAGGLALSKDRSTANSPQDFGYGLLTRADGTALPEEVIVSGVHQEHGEVTSRAALPFDDMPVGSMVRVLPNHVCMTAASYDRYVVTAGADLSVVDCWDKTGGW